MADANARNYLAQALMGAPAYNALAQFNEPMQPNALARGTLKPGPEPTGYDRLFDSIYGMLGGTPDRRALAEALSGAVNVGTLGMVTGAYDGGKELAQTWRPAALAMALMPGAKVAAPAKAMAARVGDDAIKALYEARAPLPEGWFVHGRSGAEGLRDDAVIMGTRDYDVMESYGRNGSGWALAPREDTKVLDLSGDTRDLRKVAQSMMADHRQGRLPHDMETMLPESPKVSDFYDAAAAFSPRRIVDSAEAFDNVPMVNWLWDRTKAGFIRTPDGAVAMHPDAVRSVRLFEGVGPIAGLGLGVAGLWPGAGDPQ